MNENNHVAFSKQLSCRENFLQGLASFYDLMRAETVSTFEKAAQLSDMSVNYFFANVKGDIAYYHLGRHPIRANGVDLRLPTPGTGEFEWKGYLPKGQNPNVSNPSSGYIANWNNQPEPGWGHGDLATSDVFGGWGADSRLTSLTRLVDAKKTIDQKDLKDIIKTIAFYDKRATNIKALLIKAVQGIQPKSPQVEESLLWRVLKEAAAVIACSNYEREGMIRMGINPSKIHLIPMGLNLDEWEKLNGERFRRKYDLKGKKSSFLQGRKLIIKGPSTSCRQ